ncbi:transposase (fragment) [Paraburkholderia piptadeniae]|uniref:Transposase n=1 Tax=Paraburkholderia piptadeniae TaxID=1701573 RepID=A0A1N7SS69_9BURK
MSFMREIDKAVPAELDAHCIVDKYSSHKHPKVKARLAARPRWHMHFLPTYSSWLKEHCAYTPEFGWRIRKAARKRSAFASWAE